jgi:hypothetical protein
MSIDFTELKKLLEIYLNNSILKAWKWLLFNFQFRWKIEMRERERQRERERDRERERLTDRYWLYSWYHWSKFLSVFIIITVVCLRYIFKIHLSVLHFNILVFYLMYIYSCTRHDLCYCAIFMLRSHTHWHFKKL